MKIAVLAALLASAGVAVAQDGTFALVQDQPIYQRTNRLSHLFPADGACGSRLSPAPNTWWSLCLEQQKAINPTCPTNAQAIGGQCGTLPSNQPFGFCYGCGDTYIPIMYPNAKTLTPPYDITSLRRLGKNNKGAAYKAFGQLCNEACRDENGNSRYSTVAENEYVGACGCGDGTTPLIDLPVGVWTKGVAVNGTMPVAKVRSSTPSTGSNTPSSTNTTPPSSTPQNNVTQNSAAPSSFVIGGTSVAVTIGLSVLAML